jgi:hypothetical protein
MSKIFAIIDIYTQPAPTRDEILLAESGLYGMFCALNVPVTLSISKVVARSRIRLLLAQYAALVPSMEFAVTGLYSDEEMSDLTLAEQQTDIASSIKYAKACVICGRQPKVISGFVPPILDNENSDTFQACVNCGLSWVLTDQDVSAYPLRAAQLSHAESGMRLYDREFQEAGLTADDWGNALTAALTSGEDLVIMFDSVLSGKDPSWNGKFKSFVTSAKTTCSSFATL